ncbi:UDP-Glc:alpha-D-GlcNAc-diphosphoundecaprenol beta-1,3-glucosyltransferase WfgD [compost metagenome]
MGNETLVDILVTTYNTNIEFLKKQIESIINQSYKNLKIYISDDASNQKEVIECIEDYAKKDNRIIFIKQIKNLGYNGNFEFLLNQSTADYIMFSDHDDIWYSNKVEQSLEKIQKSNCDMVYVNAKQINKDGQVIKQDYFKYKNMPLINGKDKLAISRCIGIGCSQIITKKVKDKMIPFMDKVIAHDWLAAFIANELNGITYIDNKLFEYRLHETNVFGGRNFSQNLKRWKKDNGNTFKSFLEYRKDAINRAYLGGAEMCKEYSINDENKKFINELIKYYECIKKTKIINIKIYKYFKFLYGRNLFKKMVKEIILFHFPIFSYIIFKIG